MPPKVTVAIPACKPQFLDLALRSALAQEFDSFEILVCDDCPGDAVARVVQPWLDQPGGPPVRYVRNATPLHMPGNFARCIALAQGEYVRLLCDDDMLLPGTLTTQAAVLDARADVALVSSRRILVNETSHAMDAVGRWNSPFDEDMCLHGDDVVSFLVDYPGNFIGEPSSAMFRRAQLLPLGDQLMHLDGQPIDWLGDLAMYAHLLRQGHLAMLQEVGACYRISAAQTSHARREQPGIAHPAEAHFRRKVQELGWCRDGGQHPVRAAPLTAPPDALRHQTVDLRDRLDRLERGQDPAPTLRRWLEQRRPDAAHARLIEQHLAAQPRLPRLAVFIQGEDAATRASLAPAQCQYAAVDIHRLPSAQDPAWVAAFNAQAAASGADWLLVVQAGETLVPGSLRALALALLASDDAQALYADELFAEADGSLAAVFRPGVNLDMLLAYPAGMARHLVLRRTAVLELGGLDTALPHAAELDALLRLLAAHGLGCLRHVAEPLLVARPPYADTPHAAPQELAAITRHLHARGYAQAQVAATQPGRYRIHYAHGATPLVSIVISAQGPLATLQRCVETVLEKTAYAPYELLLVAHPHTPTDASAWLGQLAALGSAQLRVLQAPAMGSLAELLDFGAQAAQGEYLLFLSDGAAALHADWLHALLNHAQRPEVGLTGAKLLRADGTVHHAGIVLGLAGVAGLAFAGQPLAAPGYMHRLEIDQNYSALGGECLMVRQSIYAEAGGLGAQPLPSPSHALDFCLRVQQRGYLAVFTPHATLLHEAHAPLPPDDATQSRRQAASDALQARWLPLMARDPAYNPHLSLTAPGFTPDIGDGARWRPLPFGNLPRVLAVAADRWGCGHYRVIQPLQALRGAGLVDGCLSGPFYPSAVEMERMAPDTLVLQRQTTREQLAALPQLTQFRHAFRVAELDDYLLQVPQGNDQRAHLLPPQEMRRALAQWLAQSDRFVVSTERLAEAMAGMHPDIRVVENRLPPAWWRGLQSRRRRGARPRVGWGGGNSHRGDLAMMADVVKTLAGEVEWVFFGLCPDALRPYVHEFSSGGLPIAQYPAALAQLDLDLAIAPLEYSLFNECKSNLRLLEYGACGYPVVCSDVLPYRCGLPVTRVKNRTRDWVNAIRTHLADLDATARAGDALRDAVLGRWMLEGKHLHAWRKAWLPD
ncbi:MAG: glycosyltransferase [Acidovorax sp.]